MNEANLTINMRNSLVRGMYWLFNLNQYRSNYYLLQGYYSWRLYEEGVSKLNGHPKTAAQNAGGFLLAKDYAITKQLPENLLTPLDQAGNGAWFYKKISIWFTKSLLTLGLEKSIENNELDPTTHFIVTENMLPHLKILGFDSEVNNHIALVELKEAKRKGLLAAHPDRNSGSTQPNIPTVQQVQEAFNDLLSLINDNSDPENIKTKRTEFMARMEIVKENLHKVQQAYTNYEKNVEQFQEQVSEHGRKIDQYCEKADRVISNSDRFMSNSDRFMSKADRFIAKADQLQTGISDLQQKVRQAMALQQQNDDSIKEIQQMRQSSKKLKTPSGTQTNNSAMFLSSRDSSESFDAANSSSYIPS